MHYSLDHGGRLPSRVVMQNSYTIILKSAQRIALDCDLSVSVRTRFVFGRKEGPQKMGFCAVIKVLHEPILGGCRIRRIVSDHYWSVLADAPQSDGKFPLGRPRASFFQD